MHRRQVITHKIAIQAFLDGKIIQWRHGDNDWEDTESPIWGLSYEYRVKPEPIIVWAIVSPVGYIFSTFPTEDQALSLRMNNNLVVKLVQDLG